MFGITSAWQTLAFVPMSHASTLEMLMDFETCHSQKLPAELGQYFTAGRYQPFFCSYLLLHAPKLPGWQVRAFCAPPSHHHLLFHQKAKHTTSAGNSGEDIQQCKSEKFTPGLSQRLTTESAEALFKEQHALRWWLWLWKVMDKGFRKEETQSHPQISFALYFGSAMGDERRKKKIQRGSRHADRALQDVIYPYSQECLCMFKD